MDLVIGATGILGQEICHGLAAAGRTVRALVRATSDPTKVERLSQAKIETVIGDLKDPPTLQAACVGVDNVISTASVTLSRAEGDSLSSVDHRGHLNLLEAIQAASVNHFVYTSFPPCEVAFELQDAKRAVEVAIRASGVAHTILQPTYFWEVWCSESLGFDVRRGKARIFGTGDGLCNWISLFDVKAAAIASLDNPAATNKTLVLGGPEALSQNEIVKRFETATGRTFDLEHIPLDVLESQYDGAEDPISRSFAALMLFCGKGGWVFETEGMQKALGIESSAIDSFIQNSCA